MHRIVFIFALSFFTTPSPAQHGPSIEQAWARETPPGITNGAVYFIVNNPTNTLERLIGVASDAADRVELHTHTEDNGVVKMRLIDAVAVPKYGMAMLEPGGDHLMLLDLSQPLKEGETIQLELEFEKAGTIRIDVPVKKEGEGINSHPHSN